MNPQNHSYNQSAVSRAFLNKTSPTEQGITVGLYLLLMLAILAGNGLVLAAFVVNKHLRTSTNTLIMGLAVSDVLVGLVSIPCWLYISVSSYKNAPFSFASYQFYITFDIFIGSASIMQLTALSMERCHAIVRPLRHRTLSMRVFYSMIAVPWLSAAVMASLQPVQFERWKEVYTLLMATICFFIPFVIIFFAYLSIFCFARSKRRGRLTRHLVEKRSYRKELRLSITIAVITGLFVIAWLPLFVVTVIGTYYPHFIPPSPGTVRLLQFVKFCHYSNSALNPFVYAYRNRDMVVTFRYIVYRLLCKVQQPLESSRSSSFRSSFRKNYYWQRQSSLQSSVKVASVKFENATKSCEQKQSSPCAKTDANANLSEKRDSVTVVVMYSAV